MLIHKWLSEVKLFSKRRIYRGIRPIRRREHGRRNGLETPEDRRLLAVFDLSSSGALAIDMAAGEETLLFSSPTKSNTDTKIRIDGQVQETYDSNILTSITVRGSAGGNRIDLRNVKSNDDIFKTLTSVTINGKGGNDSIAGSGLGDSLRGGGGADLILGGPGQDTLVGEGANDTLDGGIGTDSLLGGTGSDTLFYLPSGPQADNVTPLAEDVPHPVPKPAYLGAVTVPETGQEVTRIVGDFGDSLPSNLPILRQYAGDLSQTLPLVTSADQWGVAVFNRHWANPTFSNDGRYIKVESDNLPSTTYSTDKYDLIIDVATGNPVLALPGSSGNFRWSQDPLHASRFYVPTEIKESGQSQAQPTLVVGDVDTQTFNKHSMPHAIKFSKGGVFMRDHLNPLGGKSGEFLAVFRKSGTLDVTVLHLWGAFEPGGVTEVASYNTPGNVKDDLFVSPDGSFIALSHGVNGSPRFRMIGLGTPGSGNGIANSVNMFSISIDNVPAGITSSKGDPSQGYLPFKLAHPHFAYGQDSNVYLVGGMDEDRIGNLVPGNDVEHYQTPVGGDVSVGSLIAFNTSSKKFQLLTSGQIMGTREAPVDHTTGTMQNPNTGGVVFSSYQRRPGLALSETFIQVGLGLLNSTSNPVTKLARQRSGGVGCSECQPIPNASPDGTKLLFASTWNIDVNEPISGTVPTIVGSYLIDLFEEPGATSVELRVVRDATPTDADGETISLPDNVDFLDEWDRFSVEVWASTPSDNTSSVGSFTVEVPYDPLFDLDSIEFGPAFSNSQQVVSGSGQVEFSASSSLDDLGKDDYVLLGRVKLKGNTGSAPGSDLPNTGGYILPTPKDFVLNEEGTATASLSGTTAVTTLGPGAMIDVWPVMYDLDDDGTIGFGDTAFFAAVFGQSASQSPEAERADFDHDGIISFGDVSFYGANFGSSESSTAPRLYSSNFPDAWFTSSASAASSTSAERVVSPDASEDAYVADAWQTTIIEAPGVLANDSDSNGESLTVNPLDTAYAVTQQDGQLLVRDISGFNNKLAIREDGGQLLLEDMALAETIRIPVLSSTSSILVDVSTGNDRVSLGQLPTSLSQVSILGGSGNDIVNLQSATGSFTGVTVDGQTGNDRITGSRFADRISGGDGRDILRGGAGADFLDGGAGNDRLFGQQGNDTLYGGSGRDRLFGQHGRDTLIGRDYDSSSSQERDILNGGTGRDRLVADQSVDGLRRPSGDLVDFSDTVFSELDPVWLN